MNKYSIQPTFEYDENDMVDIISSASYSIDYWGIFDNTTDDWKATSNSLPEDHCFEDVVFALLKNGKCVVIEDAEDEDGPWELTLEKLVNGIKLTIQKGFWNGNLDDIDGEVGDIIFQYALFNEIVYG